MKKRIFPLLMALLLLCGCAPAGQGEPSGEEARLTVVATTYPVYLFATAVTQGVEGIRVERLNTGETSCLHDYTLSVNDMKLLEQADVIVMNGAGLEEFLEDALETSEAAVIDCSRGVELLENHSHHHDEHDHSHDGHDHGHWDPHYWMDPRNAVIMVENIGKGLQELIPEAYQIDSGVGLAKAHLNAWDTTLREMVELGKTSGEDYDITGLITFHDGFQYFANAYGFPLLEAIEEEAGSEASAKEIVEITELVKEHDIPVIFTEINGSDATAAAIARETGCQVAQLSMCMDGPDDMLSNYCVAMSNNVVAVVNGFAGREVIVVE